MAENPLPPQTPNLDTLGGMRYLSPIALQCQSAANDRPHNTAPAKHRSKAPAAAAQGIKPVGIFGGTFDPIHFGHLRLAEEAADSLNLENVRFVPAGLPYQRMDKAARPEHRLAMTQLAIANNPRFVLDAQEVQRDGPSYTVDTLTALRGELGSDVPIVVLMGTDAFSRITSWHRYKDLFSLAHIAILTRAGMPPDWLNAVDTDLRKELRGRLVTEETALHSGPAGCIISVPMTPLEISATEIRNKLRAGKSIRYLLPAPVLDYIKTHRLYSV